MRCPGRNRTTDTGIFSLFQPLGESALPSWGRPSSTSQDPSRQVRRSTVMHDRPISPVLLANPTRGAAGGSRRPAHRWRLPKSRSTTSSRSRSQTTRPASASVSPSRTASSMQRTGIAFTAPCGAASDPVRFRKFPPGSPCRAPPSPAVRGGARFLPPAPRGPRGAA